MIIVHLTERNRPRSCPKMAILDIKSAIERARRINVPQHLLPVMRICSAVVLSLLDTALEAQCPQKEFSCA